MLVFLLRAVFVSVTILLTSKQLRLKSRLNLSLLFSTKRYLVSLNSVHNIIIQGAAEVTPFLLFEFSSFCLISSLFLIYTVFVSEFSN